MRKLAYSVVLVLAILLGGFAGYPMISTIMPSIPRAHAVTDNIVLTGCAFVTTGCPHAGWNGTTTHPNPTITVRQGDTVSLSLTSVDTLLHQFLVDVDRDGADSSDCPAVDPCSMSFSSSTPYSFNASFAPGTYTYLCVVHPTIMVGSFVVLATNDFTINANPNMLSLVAGNSGMSTIALTSFGFSGTVALGATVTPNNPSITTSLNPSSVPLTSGGSGSSILTVSTTASTTPGTYAVNVTGTGGSLSHSATVSLTVTSSGPVGGYVVPVNILVLLAPYIAIAFAVVAAAVAAVFRLKRSDRAKDNK